MGQEQYQAAESLPFDFAAGDIQVDDGLRVVDEIAELGLPENQRFRLRQRVAVFESQDAGFRQQTVVYVKMGLGAARWFRERRVLRI